MKRNDIREKILTSKPRSVAQVEAFGVPITLQKLTWAEMQQARRVSIEGDEFRSDWYYVAMLIMSARDEDGNPVFEPLDRDDLLGQDSADMDRLVQALLALHEMTPEANEAAKNS